MRSIIIIITWTKNKIKQNYKKQAVKPPPSPQDDKNWGEF